MQALTGQALTVQLAWLRRAAAPRLNRSGQPVTCFEITLSGRIGRVCGESAGPARAGAKLLCDPQRSRCIVCSRVAEVSVAGSGQPQADGDVRERAETYLRLLAETELRRALGSPAIRRPGLGTASLPLRAAYQVLRPAAALAARAVRPLDPLVRRVLATRERVQGRALPAASPAARWAFGAASGLAAAVSTSVGAVERGGWQVRRGVRSRQAAGRFHGPGPAREGLDRVGRLASDFAAAELIDLAAAESIVDGLAWTLAARSGLEPRGAWAMRRKIRRRGSLPVGRVVAIPLGRPVTVQSEDGPIKLVLLALVLAPDRAEVIVTGRLPTVPDGRARQVHHHWSRSLRGSATDDRGARYEAHFTGGSDQSRIDGALRFHPIPPAQTRWLEVRVGETDPLRVQLAEGQPVTADLGEEPADPVERFLDVQAERFLSRRWLPGAGGAAVAPEATAALREIAAVWSGSPALRRLAALFRRLGCDCPETQGVPWADLPEPWASVLDSQDATDGPAGISALAVVFPEIDGTRCVLTGLRSEPDSASLQLIGWSGSALGWLPFAGETTRPSVWARDSAGRWHVAAGNGGEFVDGHANLTLRLTPPIHPKATSLEITLLGKSGRATATVPLAWQDMP